MPTDSITSPAVIRLVAVAPTFDNAATLRTVLDSLSAHGVSTIVVDDGCTDGTNHILESWLAAGQSDRHFEKHAANAGKAAAMRTGFARARTLGFTHAITIDTDGQHDPLDALRLAEVARRSPDAIIVGDRPCGAEYPLRSRLGRWISNALVRVISGASVGDTQCGLRVYPLDVLAALNARAGRYAFETEVLVRAAWANVEIVGVPVRCIYDVAGGRVTHFRLIRDSLSAASMHVRLFTLSVIPWPARTLRPVFANCTTGTLFDRGRRWLNPFRAWRSLRVDPRERERIGAAVGWGLFVGTQPPLGYKGALCLLLAKKFRLQPLIVLATSSLSTPPLGFVLWSAAIVVGHLLLHRSMPNLAQYDMAKLGPLPVLRAVALEWVVGGIVFGGALGVLTWLVTLAIVRSLSGRPDLATPESVNAAQDAVSDLQGLSTIGDK